MAHIIGRIESLKSLKAELKSKGVSQFKSIKEIKDFLSNYNFEESNIINNATIELEKRFSETSINLVQKKINKTNIIDTENEKLNQNMLELCRLVYLLENQTNKSFFQNIFNNIKLYDTKRKINYYTKNKTYIVNNAVAHLTKRIKGDELFIKTYNLDKNVLIQEKTKPEIKNLKYTRKVIESCKNLIAGAIGENLVVNEINKLSNDFTLINDFNLKFDTPIFYKKNNERIRSVQIDHLLISKAGIFILETKNWSKSSVNSINLRSPVSQVLRSSFALFVYISENITLRNHHWGEKKIPIKNIIVMINHKPLTNFKFVNIKLLTELNDYINYFEPVFTDSELKKLVSKLTRANNV